VRRDKCDKKRQVGEGVLKGKSERERERERRERERERERGGERERESLPCNLLDRELTKSLNHSLLHLSNQRLILSPGHHSSPSRL
jgi:hypothetical protein